MDVISAFSLIATIIGVPASVYALFQMYRDRQKPLRDAGLAYEKYFEVQRRLSELPDRVLLTFSKDNADKNGTLEHLIFSFWEKFSAHNSTGAFYVSIDEFIFNPSGVLASAKLRVSHQRQSMVLLAVLLVFLAMLPFVIYADGYSRRTIGVILYVIMACWLFLAVAVYAVRFNQVRLRLRESFAALAVVSTYVETLQRFDIAIRVEFTQSRAKYIEYHGDFSSASSDSSVPKITALAG